MFRYFWLYTFTKSFVMNFGWVQELKKNRYIPVHDEAWTSKNCSTFGELADRFIDSVLFQGRSYDRIDIVFDRYRVNSIKESKNL